MKSISKRAAFATVVAGAGATATTALAVPPPPSSQFEGDTSQTKIEDHSVKLQTNPNGRVGLVGIGWRAKCKVKGKFWSANTRVSGGADGLTQNGDVFGVKGSYSSNAGGGIK